MTTDTPFQPGDRVRFRVLLRVRDSFQWAFEPYDGDVIECGEDRATIRIEGGKQFVLSVNALLKI